MCCRNTAEMVDQAARVHGLGASCAAAPDVRIKPRQLLGEGGLRQLVPETWVFDLHAQTSQVRPLAAAAGPVTLPRASCRERTSTSARSHCRAMQTTLASNCPGMPGRCTRTETALCTTCNAQRAPNKDSHHQQHYHQSSPAFSKPPVRVSSLGSAATAHVCVGEYAPAANREA